MKYDKSNIRICDTCERRFNSLYYRNKKGVYVKTNIIYCVKCEELFD